MVKPSCLGVLVVSMVAGDAVEGRSATAAALTEDERDAQMCLPAQNACSQFQVDLLDTACFRKPCKSVPCEHKAGFQCKTSCPEQCRLAPGDTTYGAVVQ